MSERSLLDDNDYFKIGEYLAKDNITVSEYEELVNLGVNTDCMPKLKVNGRTLCYYPKLVSETLVDIEDELTSKENQ